jgi:hypothetical protein
MVIAIIACILAQLLSLQSIVLFLSISLFSLACLSNSLFKEKSSTLIDIAVNSYVSLILIGIAFGLLSGFGAVKVLNNGAPFLSLLSFYYFRRLSAGALLKTLRIYLNFFAILAVFLVIFILLFRNNSLFYSLFEVFFGSPSSYTGFDDQTELRLYAPRLFMLFPVPFFMFFHPNLFYPIGILARSAIGDCIARPISVIISFATFNTIVLSALSDASVIIYSFIFLLLLVKFLKVFSSSRITKSAALIASVLILSVFAFAFFYDRIGFSFSFIDFQDLGNVKRLALSEDILSSTQLFPSGFGASIQVKKYALDALTDYNSELSYLNLYHKFGLASILFLPIIFIWLRSLYLFLVSPSIQSNYFHLFYFSSSLYLVFAIGNPILSLPSFLFIQGFSLACLRSSGSFRICHIPV